MSFLRARTKAIEEGERKSDSTLFKLKYDVAHGVLGFWGFGVLWGRARGVRVARARGRVI